MEQTYFVYNTPLGRVTLAQSDGALTHMAFGVEVFPGEEKAVALTNQAATELVQYLAGKRQIFDVPLAPQGTDFQKLVWAALQDIPYGQTSTYAELAAAIGKPTAARAVGGANNKNPLPIFIPCHRVVGANGNLVGYAYGLPIKEFLLDLEAQTSNNQA